MYKQAIIVFLSIMVLSGYAWSEKSVDSKATICLLTLETPPGVDLGYMAKSIRDVIINSIHQYPGISYYEEGLPAEYLKEPDKILLMDKVQLLRVRRETGFDGIIFGELEIEENELSLNLHLVDFSSGRIYFTDKIKGSFGSALLEQLEDKLNSYFNTLLSYYNCTLELTSDPQDAEVWINGEKVGNTPLSSLDVKEGLITFQIKKQDYIAYESSIDLKAGQKGIVHVLLNKYSLTATSNPPGANVLINGNIAGVTPLSDITLDQPQINIEFRKSGFVPYVDNISLTPGEHAYIHAELYDFYVRSKLLRWNLSSHNLCFVQTVDLQDLSQIELDAFPVSNFRYYANFGRISAGLNLGISSFNASEHFDTFLGPKEGYEQFPFGMFRGSVFGQYNILERKQVEFYIGAFTGVSSVNATRSDAPIDLNEIQSVRPLIGGEIGINLYLARILKASVLFGGYHAGDFEYATKKASYWGAASYEKKSIALRPLYVGLSLTLVNPVPISQ